LSRKKNTEIIVVGSSFSSVHAAKVLLDNNKKVEMIDIGDKVDNKTLDTIEFIKNHKLYEHNLAEYFLNEVKSKFKSSFKPKRKFNSEFVYSGNDTVEEKNEFLLASSGAHGGFSNVWGAAILGPSNKELLQWGQDLRLIEKEISEVLSEIPYSAELDNMQEIYPMYVTPKANHNQYLNDLSQQLKRNLGNKSKDFIFGSSRLAIQGKNQKNGCVQCNNCMVGCVLNAIYSTQDELPKLISRGLVYRSNLKFISYKKCNDLVEIQLLNTQTNRLFTECVEKVLIGAGPAESSRIFLRSEKEISEVQISDSKLMIFPIIYLGKVKSWEKEGISLSKIFIAFDLPEEVLNFIQIYDCPPDMISRVHQQNNIFKIIPPIILKYIFKHTLLAFLYLDETLSDKIGVKMSSKNEFTYKSSKNPDFKKNFTKIKKKLRKIFRETGFHPIFVLSNKVPAGAGFHFGSNFSEKNMRLHGSPYFNTIGASINNPNVHFVDASVLPRIFAGPIALTIMANSRRLVKKIWNLT
jgi:Pyruvate/2-oxoacid:ferredoxin oxidoreductase delta subunit